MVSPNHRKEWYYTVARAQREDKIKLIDLIILIYLNNTQCLND